VFAMAARFYAPEDCKMKPSKPGVEHGKAEGSEVDFQARSGQSQL